MDFPALLDPVHAFTRIIRQNVENIVCVSIKEAVVLRGIRKDIICFSKSALDAPAIFLILSANFADANSNLWPFKASKNYCFVQRVVCLLANI